MRITNFFSCYALLVILYSCKMGAGTLGGFEDNVFPVSKKRLDNAIDSLYKEFPQYKIPEKWIDLDNWSARGYDFLESNIFYFKDNPEEMYYVTYIGDQETLQDTTKVTIAIRAVIYGRRPWLLHEDLSEKDRQRISKRFKEEIISRLNNYLKKDAAL